MKDTKKIKMRKKWGRDRDDKSLFVYLSINNVK